MCNYCGHVLVNRNVPDNLPSSVYGNVPDIVPDIVPDNVVRQSCQWVRSNSSLSYYISTHTTNNYHIEWLTQVAHNVKEISLLPAPKTIAEALD
jgi:hypothetical protein